jgi:hypothetical protein
LPASRIVNKRRANDSLQPARRRPMTHANAAVQRR